MPMLALAVGLWASSHLHQRIPSSKVRVFAVVSGPLLMFR